MQELQEFKPSFVDGPKPTHGLDIKVMDHLIFTSFLLCIIVGCLVLGGMLLQAPSTSEYIIFEQIFI